MDLKLNFTEVHQVKNLLIKYFAQSGAAAEASTKFLIDDLSRDPDLFDC